jgi:hypothetical protein
VTALRDKTAAVPGFCPSLASLLEVCADDPGEAGKHAQAVAEDVLGPAKHRTKERNE